MDMNRFRIVASGIAALTGLALFAEPAWSGDALKGWMLENDGKRWYRERISKFHDMDCVRVRIEEIGK